MRAQVTLTSAESKKLIAKAVVQMDVFKKPLTRGVIVIHPSTTTLFIMEEIMGKRPRGRFVSGIIVPKGACISRETQLEVVKRGGPGRFPFLKKFRPWVIKDGKVQKGVSLGEALEEMGPGDVYIKTGNALDHEGNVGVLVGSLVGGTVARAFGVCTARGVNLIIPIGLEKLIPISVRDASSEAGIKRMDYSTGMPVGLFPINGIVVTELEAIRILTGARAIPISAGGVAGAEGAITLVIREDEKRVREAIKIIEPIKGTKLPKVIPGDCLTCVWPTCPFRGIIHNIARS